MARLKDAIQRHAVALVSLVVALTALGYNTWRNERTEHNRNLRTAGFELIRELGSLQQIVFYAHYSVGDSRGDSRMGWADVLTITDLAALMPQEVGAEAADLRAVWQVNWEHLGQDDEAYARIDAAIDGLRGATRHALLALE
ncbi:MAG: hypothetical protein R3E77_00625 [Steroidobacteraceae bacterium]